VNIPSDRIEFIKPMKAKQTNRSKKQPDGTTYLKGAEEMIAWVGTIDPTEYWAEIKENGQRVQVQDYGFWTTRPTWVPKDDYPHICSYIPPGCVFDGELMPNDGEGHEVVSHYRSSHPQKLKLVVFDILYVGGVCVMDDPLEVRRKKLQAMLDAAPTPNIELAHVFEDDFAQAMRDALAQGREGLIIKNRFSNYKPGSRSKWLKCKATETVDVVITDCDSKPTEWRVRPGHKDTHGVVLPEGRHSDPWIAGYVGLSYGFYDDKGQLRRVGSLGVTGTLEDMRKHVGRVAEVDSFGPQFPTGAIQHPSFKHWRDDKHPISCVFAFDEADGVNLKALRDLPESFDPVDMILGMD